MAFFFVSYILIGRFMTGRIWAKKEQLSVRERHVEEEEEEEEAAAAEEEEERSALNEDHSMPISRGLAKHRRHHGCAVWSPWLVTSLLA